MWLVMVSVMGMVIGSIMAWAQSCGRSWACHGVGQLVMRCVPEYQEVLLLEDNYTPAHHVIREEMPVVTIVHLFLIC